MAMLPSPAAGLLSGLMAGNQARMQRETLQLQKDEAQRRRDEQRFVHETEMRKSLAENLTPETRPMYQNILSGFKDFHGTDWSSDLDPDNLPQAGALRPSSSNPALAGGAADYEVAGYGSAGAMRRHRAEQDAYRLQEIRAGQEIEWGEAYAKNGTKFAEETVAAVLQSNEPGADLATLYSEAVNTFGPENAWEIFQHQLPLIRAAVDSEADKMAAYIKSGEDLQDFKENQMKEYRTSVMQIMSGRSNVGLDALKSGDSFLEGDRLREKIALLLDYGLMLIQDNNVLGKAPYTWADALSQALTTYGRETGIVPEGAPQSYGSYRTDFEAGDLPSQLDALKMIDPRIREALGDGHGQPYYDQKTEEAYVDSPDGRTWAWDPSGLHERLRPIEPEAPELGGAGGVGLQVADDPWPGRGSWAGTELEEAPDPHATTGGSYWANSKRIDARNKAAAETRAKRREIRSRMDKPRLFRGTSPRSNTGFSTNEMTGAERSSFHQGLMTDIRRREP